MEATAGTKLTRSTSLSPRLRRSRTYTVIRAASPARMTHTAHSSTSLRRATSDLDLSRSAPTSPLPLLLDIVEEDAVLDGAARGKGNNRGGHGGGGRGAGGSGQQQMGEYYRRVLRAEPENPLLLRNYGRYLHEVEGDLAGAEDCYARALLACPDDADLLSLYGQLLWEARRDKERAAAYLQRAVQQSPDDCHVLGSYASFLWDAEDDDDDKPEAAAAEQCGAYGSSPPLVPALAFAACVHIV